jgi:predicted dehydrogenase
MGRQHAAALRHVSSVELVALADIDRDRLDRLGGELGVDGRHTDLREMLDRARPELVAVCTQAPNHADATVAAADAGVRGVLCEKPIALSLAEADRMMEACAARGVTLAINHPLRMCPAVARAASMLRAGAIGELLTIRMIDKGGRPAGNSLMEIGTHLFDCARVFAGDAAWTWAHLSAGGGEGSGLRAATPADVQPSRVAWPGDRDCGLVVGERGTAVFGFAPDRTGRHRGIQATYQTFFQPPTRRWTTGLELIGLEGVMALRSAGEGVLDLYLHRGPWATPGQFEPVLVGEAARHRVPGLPTDPGTPFAAGLVVMFDDLAAAVDQRREHASSGHDGRAALEMIMGVFASHRRGAPVALPLEDRSHPLVGWLDAHTAEAPT